MLVVEDSSIVRERLVALIGERVPAAMPVVQTEDGHEALRLFRHHRPDAVVLDLQLPGLSGLDLIEHFRRDHPSCVLVVLTNHSSAAFRQRCADLGTDYFFDKTAEFDCVPDVLAGISQRQLS